ncbi:hypothetical protein [Metabacillus fastidiosus]|uniref:Uncharacterized protein n=1 Tax=Metabacillus fastidiosus TaxID=1458 RepID=A0ABU6NVS7_9BACI|nr:hypothetical protein [Metabacillus fastidiosus]MED4400344.1 hypothetical protein [Metabacillus fastidiosus]
MDRFSKVLTPEEADSLLITYNQNVKRETQSKYFEQEAKFLNFFNYAYKLNGETPVYVYCPDILDILRKVENPIIKFLDDKDIQLFDTLYENIKITDNLYKVDKELLQFFAKLSLRELCFSNFFFSNSDSVIIGNYELNFPIYCLNEDSMLIYGKKAFEVGLFIRK